MTRPGEQADLFHTCDWCGLPAVGEVELEPAVIRKAKDGTPTLIKRAIVAWGCDRHVHVGEAPDQAGNLNFRRTKDRHAKQLELFGGDDAEPGNAIYGDTA